MTWTHSQCEDCWDKANPDGRVPVQMRDAKPEACCFCGKTTTAGIYVRHDPRTLSCEHPEEDWPVTPPDPAPDPAAAELERIRERASKTGSGYSSDPRTYIYSQADVPRLLAAVEAVLAIHQSADRGTGAQCKGCSTHVTFTRWPCPTVQAITSALTGKEAS